MLLGLDLIAIQDHAYNHAFVDTWTLIAVLAAKTHQIHFMPDVADLPLRPPPMLAKAVATLDRLTDGRAELAIGAGAFWDGIAGMSGPLRAPAKAVGATAADAATHWTSRRWVGQSAQYLHATGRRGGVQRHH